MWRSVDYIKKIEGVSRQTVGRWIREGKYDQVKKTEGGHYRIWLEEEPVFFLYARVSTSKQKSSLDYQQESLRKAYPNGKLITDVASGFNFERRGFKTILERSLSGTPCVVVATTQDRITRTGFGLVSRLIELSGGEVRILEKNPESSENFDTQSLVSFLTSYINSIYGKRSAARRTANNNEEN